MKAKIKFNINIEIDIETQKTTNNTTVMDLELKASNLGNCLFDTLRHMNTHTILNDKINKDYKAFITGLGSTKSKEIIIID